MHIYGGLERPKKPTFLRSDELVNHSNEQVNQKIRSDEFVSCSYNNKNIRLNELVNRSNK